MSSMLPTTISAWIREAKCNHIDRTQTLDTGAALVSGSNFRYEHFLRLRVLYSDIQSPATLTVSPGFPSGRVEEMKIILDGDEHVTFVKNFLKNDNRVLKSSWDVDRVRMSGLFAIAMENLHLIATRPPPIMKENEEMSEPKIVLSPLKTRSMAQSGAHSHEFSNAPMVYSTPIRPKPISYYESPISGVDADVSGLSITPPGKEGAQLKSEHERAKNIAEKSCFSPGDEQTVNSALVSLIMALSWLLGRTGRVRHDRATFSISNFKDSKFDLYTAAVDGLIMHLDEDKLNGFMEVKRDLRGANRPVRFQIAAQMAAFIFEQDVVLAQQDSEREVEKGSKKPAKGKGKEVSATTREAKTKIRDGGRPEEFSKWMVSLDGYLAYINIATYNQRYVEFLSGGQPSIDNDAFMTMKEYGPFDLRIWSGSGGGLGLFLKYLGTFMLGTDSVGGRSVA